MASNIDPTKPVEGNALTANVRDNFSAAKDEIEALQAADIGAMKASVYDPAAIVEQVVGVTATQTLTGKTLNSDTNSIHADAVHIKSRNVSGGPFIKGQVIYESAYNSGQDAIEILLADADDGAKMPGLGIVDEGILNNANGSIVKLGTIAGDSTDNLDTTGGGEAWVVGDDLFISITPGALTNVRPTGAAELVQSIATVLRVHASLGVIFVNGAGRVNDTPNSIAVSGTISGNGGPTTITGSRGGNAALASLLTDLDALGLIVDGTT